VDLYLIHFPRVTPVFEDAWKEFEKIKADGLARSIGVSNFTADDLQVLLKTASVLPSPLAVRLTPRTGTSRPP
jgi:diketogulonate reductase-like aldo/keto reductase